MMIIIYMNSEKQLYNYLKDRAEILMKSNLPESEKKLYLKQFDIIYNNELKHNKSIDFKYNKLKK